MTTKPKSIQLTNRMRETIVDAMLADTLAVEEKALNEKARVLAWDVLNAYVPKLVLEAYTKHSEYFGKERYVRVVGVGISTREYYIQPTRHFMHYREAYELFGDVFEAGTIRLKEDALCTRIERFRQEQEKFIQRGSDAVTALRSVLKACKTLAQLELAWPEGEAYYKALRVPEEAQKVALPTVLAAEVNRLIPLPKSAA